MQLGLVVGSLHHLFQWATNSLGTELASLAVWWALQSSLWWLYLISSVKPCDRVANATAQQRKSKKKTPTFESCVCTPCQPSHTDIPSGPASSTALHCTLGKHHRVKSILVPCCLCAFSFSNAHTHMLKRGKECLALLRWLSGRSTALFSGNSTRVLQQLFQFLIRALETEDQVTFLSSHQH